MAELGRGFVFVVILLFTFAFFISIIPAEFIGDPASMDYYDSVPDKWVGDQIAGWDEEFSAYNNVTVNKDWVEHDINVGGHDVEIIWGNDWLFEDPLSFKHEVKVFIFTGYHLFDESPLWETDVQNGIESGTDPETSKQIMNCQNKDHAYTWYVSITYNDTKFDSMTEAYDGTIDDIPELRIFVGLGWNATLGSVNAWNVVGQLLSFQTPDVGSSEINVLIGFSLWSCIIYLAYRLILMAIPFMGGGG